MRVNAWYLRVRTTAVLRSTSALRYVPEKKIQCRNEEKMNIERKTTKMVLTGIFSAIIIVMASIPFLGFIPLGVINVTILQVPVIIGAILLGPKYGAFLGFMFGLCSFLNATLRPSSLSAFVFTPFLSNGNLLSLIVCFVPRILIGVTSYYSYKWVKGHFDKKNREKDKKARRAGESKALLIAGVVGSMTNTLLVMNFIFLFFTDTYAQVMGVTGGAASLYWFILGIIGINGVPEAIASALIKAAVLKVLLHIRPAHA